MDMMQICQLKFMMLTTQLLQRVQKLSFSKKKGLTQLWISSIIFFLIFYILLKEAEACSSSHQSFSAPTEQQNKTKKLVTNLTPITEK